MIVFTSFCWQIYAAKPEKQIHLKLCRRLEGEKLDREKRKEQGKAILPERGSSFNNNVLNILASYALETHNILHKKNINRLMNASMDNFNFLGSNKNSS